MEMEPRLEEVQETTTSKKTRMVAPEASTKIKADACRIRLLRDTMIRDEIMQAGTEVEVPEPMAQELCRPIVGPYDYSGYRSSDRVTRHNLTRAVKVH